MTDASKTTAEQIETLQDKATKLEEQAREAGLLPDIADNEEEGVGQVTGLVP